MKVFGDSSCYDIVENNIKIYENMIYGFVYDFSKDSLPYRDDIVILNQKKEIIYKAQICKMYETKEVIEIFLEDDNLEIYIFPNFVQKKYYSDTLSELFDSFSNEEKGIVLNRWNETVVDYYNKYLLLKDKETLNQSRKSQLLEIRTLKQFKFSANKYSKETKMKLVKFILLSLEEKKLSVVDEIAFRDYYTIFEGCHLTSEELEVLSDYVLSDICANLLREYDFYNHDYLADYHSLKNLQFISYENSEIRDFLTKRLFITLNIAFTEDCLGKENTPIYYKLLGDSVEKIIADLDNENLKFLQKKIELLFENLQWFQIQNTNMVNFGDCDNLTEKYNVKKIGRKLFETTGYAISTWQNNSALYIKYKTLSTIHSHCDDGSFIYTHEGQPIFVDPGLYKYEEKNETRRFVRSLSAHNNITKRLQKIESYHLNQYILNNSEYKKFTKKNCGFVRLIDEKWVECGELSLDYKWLEDIKIVRNFKVISANNFKISHKIKTKTTEYLQFRFNLDEMFNDSIIEQNTKKNELTILSETKKIIIISSRPINFSVVNSYKCKAKEALVKIKQVVFTRQINGTDEIDFDIRVSNVKALTEEKVASSKKMLASTERIDNKTIKYLHFRNPNNKKNNLLIIFQSLMVPYEEFYNTRKEANTYEEFLELMNDKIGRHSFFYFKDFPDIYQTDFLYIEDNNSDYYGWYMLDHNYFVNKNYVSFLDNFITKNNYIPENVFAFGSSKGGFASLLLGVECKSVGNVITVIPQINLIKFFNGMPEYKKYFYEEMLNNDYTNVYAADNILNMIIPSQTKITLFTGVGDSQYSNLMEWIERYKNNNLLKFELIVEEEKISHNDIFKKNIKKIEEILKEKLM